MTFIWRAHGCDEEKLELLRQLDRFRDWLSLDDKRYCLQCGKMINGREIQLVGDTDGSAGWHLVCPTKSCHSIAKDWVLPTGVLAGIAMHKGLGIGSGREIKTHERQTEFKVT